jgi:hypothetical protein
MDKHNRIRYIEAIIYKHNPYNPQTERLLWETYNRGYLISMLADLMWLDNYNYKHLKKKLDEPVKKLNR